MRFLPYGRHALDEDDVAAVAEVLRGDWLTTGPTVDAFERKLAARLGVRHAVSCSSGTAALHIAYAGLALGPKDVVVVPAITFLATANAARHLGAEVAFADVDPETGLMRPSDLEQVLQQQKRGHVRAVATVHLAGQVADPPGVAKLATRHGLTVVEDACHALGTVYESDVSVGSCRHSRIATFSMHPVKAIAMGEGGAITTNDDNLAERCRRFRNHGMTRNADNFRVKELAFAEGGTANPWYYEMADPGWNYRASDIHCALGLSQLAKVNRMVATRRRLVDAYDRALARLAPIVRPLGREEAQSPAWHLYIVLIDFAAAGTDRCAVMKRLRDLGVGTQVHYIPVACQPYYRDRYGEPEIPGAMSYYRRCLSLPLFVGMDESDVDRVVAALEQVLGCG